MKNTIEGKQINLFINGLAMDKIKKLFEEDWKKRDEVIYRNNKAALTKRLYDLWELAEERWIETWKIRYYEAYCDLDDIISEDLDNGTLKRCLDGYKRLK